MDEYLVKETIAALKIHLAEYLNSVWKTFAALMVSIGWLISSSDAREFIANNDKVQVSAVVIVVLMAFAHLSTLIDLYRKSERAKKALGNNLEPLLLSVVDTYSIPKYYPYFSFLINGLLYAGLLGLILLSEV